MPIGLNSDSNNGIIQTESGVNVKGNLIVDGTLNYDDSGANRLNSIEYFQPLATSTNNWTFVKWIPEVSRFIALANSGNGSRIAYSEDGDNWTYSVGVPSNFVPQDVVYYSVTSSLIVTGSAGTGVRMLQSTNSGVNWTSVLNASINSLTCYRIILYSNKLIITAGNGNNFVILDTTDLVTFTTRVNISVGMTTTAVTTAFYDSYYNIFRLVVLFSFPAVYTINLTTAYAGVNLTTIFENYTYTVLGTASTSVFFQETLPEQMSFEYNTPAGLQRFALALRSTGGPTAGIPLFLRVKSESVDVTANNHQFSTNALIADSLFTTIRIQSSSITALNPFTTTGFLKGIQIGDIIIVFGVNRLYKTLLGLGPYSLFTAVPSFEGGNPSFNYLAYSPTLDKFVGVCNSNMFMREVGII